MLEMPVCRQMEAQISRCRWTSETVFSSATSLSDVWVQSVGRLWTQIDRTIDRIQHPRRNFWGVTLVLRPRIPGQETDARA